MAFELEDFTRTGSIGKGGALWMYTTDDSNDAVLLGGYFNNAYSSLRVGDIVTCSTGADLIFVEVISISKRTVTVALATADITSQSNRVLINSVDDFPATLDSDKQYFIEGHVNMGTRSLEVPLGGLHIQGLGLNLSSLYSTSPSHALFTTPASGGCGSLLVSETTLSISGSGSEVFALLCETPNEAVEFQSVRFLNCSDLGFLGGFTQGSEANTVRLFGSPSLTFVDDWAAGYRISSSIVRGLSGAMTEPLFKAGLLFTMQSRFLTDINVDLPASASFADFAEANFPNPSTLQVQGAIFTRAGVSDASDSNYFPNITAASIASSWAGNQGLGNTFAGGRKTVATEVETVISTVDVFVTLAGTQTSSDLQHFDSPSNGQLRHIGNSPREYTVVADKTIVGKSNNVYTLRLRKWDNSSSTFSTEYAQTRQINNLTGGRDVCFFTIVANVSLDTNDYVYFEIANNTGTDNATSEIDSFFIVQER